MQTSGDQRRENAKLYPAVIASAVVIRWFTRLREFSPLPSGLQVLPRQSPLRRRRSDGCLLRWRLATRQRHHRDRDDAIDEIVPPGTDISGGDPWQSPGLAKEIRRR